MLMAFSNFALTSVTSGDSTLITIALGVAILSLVVAFTALSWARQVGSAARVAVNNAQTASTKPVGSMAAGFPSASGTDDHQLVAVITAAIATVMADEPGSSGAAPKISSIRRIGPVVSAAPTCERTGNGPYAGFVVRRIRRV